MDNDDDVEHLFSWLQTPELRYREFAGAREITDTIVTWQARVNTAAAVEAERPTPGNTQLDEEYPADQFPDQVATQVEFIPAPPQPPPPLPRGTEIVQPMPMARPEPHPRPHTTVEVTRTEIVETEIVATEVTEKSPFSLGAAGRNVPRQAPAEWVGPRPPLIQTPTVQPAIPVPPVQTVPPSPAAEPSSGNRLLGGSYRETGTNGHDAPAPPRPPQQPPSAPVEPVARSLDAVFGRLSGSRGKLPDPRDRLRHIPGLGPPGGRTR